MPKFKPYDYNQTSMVVINYQDQLQPGTFEYALHHLISHQVDLSVFYPKYQNDEGAASREIQWCCETNILFKALSCDSVPHWTTIANFISSRPQEIESLFEQVLLICDEQGLLGKELFAIDGCKMSSNAAKEWSGTHKELAAKQTKLKRQIRHHLNEHQRLDKSEARESERIKRAEQAIETLNSAHVRITKFLKTQAPRMGQGKRRKEVKSNITDNQSAKMTTSKGTIQGYNGVATVDKKHQIIVDAQAFGEGQEHHTLKPVLEATRDRLNRLSIRKDIFKGRYKPIITADTGFANEANMQYLHDNTVNAYIPDNQFRSRDPKFQDQKDKHGKRHQKLRQDRKHQVIPASEFTFDPVGMTCDCPAGNRLSVVEPVFANIGTNKKLSRFSLRGKEKVQSQWRLYCLVHNIEKLANYGAVAA